MKLCSCTVCHYCAIYNLYNQRERLVLPSSQQQQQKNHQQNQRNYIILCKTLSAAAMPQLHYNSQRSSPYFTTDAPPPGHCNAMQFSLQMSDCLTGTPGWMDGQRERQWCDSRVPSLRRQRYTNNNNITISLNG